MASGLVQEIDGVALATGGPQSFGQEFFVAYITDLERVVDKGGVDEKFGLKWYTPEMEFQNTNGAVYTGEQMASWGIDLFAPFCVVAHSVDSIVTFTKPDGVIQVHAYGKRILKLKKSKARLEPDFAIPFAVRNQLGRAVNGNAGYKGYQWHDFRLYWDTAPLKTALSDDATVFQSENPSNTQ